VSQLAAIASAAARTFGDRPALVHDETTLSHTQLDALAAQIAGGLARHGVRAGELVALVLPSGPEYVVAYLALARLEAVTTGVGPRLTPAERARVLERASPAVVIASEELAEGVPPGPALLTCATARSDAKTWRGLPLGPEERGRAPARRPPPPDAGSPEVVVFTSGTTGTPKGALFTSKQIAAITDMDSAGPTPRRGATLIATGLSHVGFMTKLAGHLKQGTTMHLLARWRAEDALRTIARERIAYVGGVAAQISLMLRLPDFASYDLSAVRGLIVGGGPSPPALVREARARFGAGYSIRYSSTESGGLGTLTDFDAPDEEALFTVGRPRPGVEVSIRSPATDERLANGETGQVWLRSPAVMDGYWRDPEATAAVLDPEGWLRTGDVGCIDERGCLRITGRLSEMYIRGGYNVYPEEVEGVLVEHPAIAAVAVVARPSPVMGEIGVAVVVPRPGRAPPTLADLRAFAGRRLAAYKLPEALSLVDDLPHTAMDKVDRRALAARERLQERADLGGEGGGHADGIGQRPAPLG